MNNGTKAALVGFALGTVSWWIWGRSPPPEVAAEEVVDGAGPGVAGTGPRSVPELALDLKKSTRAAIVGHVRDREGRPIVGAQVCASAETMLLATSETRTPTCTRTEKDGRYRLEELFGVRQRVSAMAPTYVPAVYHRGEGVGRRETVDLRPGMEARDIDIVLQGGGVEVKGVVRDLSGGLVSGATVHAEQAVGFADAEGAFSLWVRPGEVWLSAQADGYTSGYDSGLAPGHAFEVFLTPEAVLIGKVVRAGDGSPVEGARVVASADGWGGDAGAFTDAGGNFRLDGLEPGAYKPKATADDALGLATEQVVLGMGETSAPLVIEAHPAFYVDAVMVTADGGTCDAGSVQLTDKVNDRSGWGQPTPDGRVRIGGLLPGTYTVGAACEGMMAPEKFEPVVVQGASVTGIKWQFEAGLAIRGVVVDDRGEPVQKMYVSATAKPDPAAPRAHQTGSWGRQTEEDGRFELAGLLPGAYEVRVNSWGAPRATPDKPTQVVLTKGKDAEIKVTLPATAELRGRVRDAKGKPVPKARVRLSGGSQWISTVAADDGTFALPHAPPGEYRAVAMQGWDEMRAPGTGDDDVQGVKVTLVAGGRETVELVVEDVSGTISGVVRAEGGPVADAFIEATRESDSAAAAAGGGLREVRWGNFFKTPVLTDQDGRFTVTGLPPGKHTLRAHRNGGGEALREHVEIGSEVELTIAVPGTIGGTVGVRGGEAPEEFSIALHDEQTGYRRSDRFFRTRGTWRLPEVPRGSFKVTVTAGEGSQEVTVGLGEGEVKTDVRIELAPRVTLRGTVVDLEGAPVAGLRVSASNGGGFMMGAFGDDEKENITDAGGRYELPRTPPGKVEIMVMPRNWGGDAEYEWSSLPMVLPEGQAVVEVPPIRVAKRRVKQGEVAGELGYTLREAEPGADPMTRRLVVAVVRPGGPAAAAGLKVGDEIVQVEGQDVTGPNAYLHNNLTRVLADTTVTLGLASGAQLQVTAGKKP